MLLPLSDLNAFNNLVTPLESEAYDILKYRSSVYDDTVLNDLTSLKMNKPTDTLFSPCCS